MEKCNCESSAIAHISTTGLQKLYAPVKTYLYMLNVRTADGSEYKITVSYLDLVQLDDEIKSKLTKNSVKDIFRNFSGSRPPKLETRRLSLGGQKKATKNLQSIANYCNAVLTIESAPIRKLARRFFNECQTCNIKAGTIGTTRAKTGLALIIQKSNEEMQISSPIHLPIYRVVETFKADKDEKKQISLNENERVHIHKKCNTGWWYVCSVSEGKFGWFPVGHLMAISDHDYDEPAILNPPEQYQAIMDYEARNSDEVSFKTGDVLLIDMKGMDGWWSVSQKDAGSVRYAPASLLKPCDIVVSPCGGSKCLETLGMKAIERRISTVATTPKIISESSRLPMGLQNPDESHDQSVSRNSSNVSDTYTILSSSSESDCELSTEFPTTEDQLSDDAEVIKEVKLVNNEWTICSQSNASTNQSNNFRNVDESTGKDENGNARKTTEKKEESSVRRSLESPSGAEKKTITDNKTRL